MESFGVVLVENLDLCRLNPDPVEGSVEVGLTVVEPVEAHIVVDRSPLDVGHLIEDTQPHVVVEGRLILVFISA